MCLHRLGQLLYLLYLDTSCTVVFSVVLVVVVMAAAARAGTVRDSIHKPVVALIEADVRVVAGEGTGCYDACD